MDRAIDSHELRRRRIRRIAVAVAGISGAALLWWMLPELLRPSVARTDIRTASVERGPLEATMRASGTVIPAFDKVVSSPVDARVLRILKQPGAIVKPGEEILQLDTSAARLDFERLVDQLAQKTTEQRRLQIELRKQVGDLQREQETRRLDFEILQYRLQQQVKLHEEGLAPEESLRQAQVEVRKAEVELAHLETSLEQSRELTDARIAGLDLEIGILAKERDQARRQLEGATARADVEGIVTWVVEDVGATVARGEILARIADLTSFRIEATMADTYASRLAPGQTVKVQLGEERLAGHVANVFPAMEAGTVRFTVELLQPSHARLRQNLRVDVSVVTDSLADVLRVRKGPFARSGPDQQVFVVRDGRAVRTDARFGLSGYEYFEIVDGLEEGLEVIISNMKDYTHLKEIRIK